MKIIATADIHGRMSVYEWLITAAKGQMADLAVLAGDLSAGGWSEQEQHEEAHALVSVLERFRVPTLYLMGNDDFFPLTYESALVKPLHGRRLDVGGYNFVGYQYSPPFVGSIHEKPDEEIENDLRTIEPLFNDRTVLVTHSPAHGVLDCTYSGEHVGSRALAALIERQPVLAHIHGHIHDSFGREGNHFNLAAGGECRAALIELPFLNHAVLRGD